MYKGGRPILDTDVLKILEYINYGNTILILMITMLFIETGLIHQKII